MFREPFFSSVRLEVDRTRFGPAGFPMGCEKEEAFEYLNKLKLGTMEYQAVRRVPTKLDSLKKLGKRARDMDIVLTLHAPYAINLASKDEEKALKSVERLYLSAKAAEAIGARHVTFHPGYYSQRTPEEALKLAINSLKELVQRLKSENIGVELGPETTGKPSQLGSLEEVLRMAEEVDQTFPTIDFAHIHAREGGSIKGRGDYARILDEIEGRLGTLNGLVIHFTEVELTSSGKGEKMHHELGSSYGPDFKPLADEMAERGVKWLVISESPLLEEDSLKMKNIYLRALKKISSNVK